jgi:DNA-binding response OmpR family regulator
MCKGEDVKKVLLALTDGEALRLLKFKLSKEEYYILLASSGERTLELVAAEKPDLIIMDSSLPGRDSREVCRHIRRHPHLSQTLLILLIAFGEALRFREGLERGADDYILKPFNLEEVTARVKALMRRQSREGEQSPVIDLPGHALVKKEIKRRIDWEEKFALCLLTFDHFRAYNEVFGFDFGDRAIQQLGNILTQVKQKIGPKGFYLGHMRADNFIALLDPDYAEPYCQEAIRLFEVFRPELFPQSDLKRGYIVATDKTGRMRRYSLMALSIGVVTPELCSFESVQEALDAGLWARHKAKARGGSNYYLRRDGPTGLVDARNGVESKKILVVDHDTVSLRVLKSKLEREGFAVQTATTGQEAVEIVQEDPPDLIFLGASKPKLDGYQTVSCLKKDARTATIPLVMLTAQTDGEKDLALGADDYLVKSCSFKYLMRKVEQHLNRH